MLALSLIVHTCTATPWLVGASTNRSSTTTRSPLVAGHLEGHVLERRRRLALVVHARQNAGHGHGARRGGDLGGVAR